MPYRRIIPQANIPFTRLSSLPGDVVDELDQENITDEELVDIINWRFNPQRWAHISAVFGDPDFLPFSVLEQGVNYGQAVGRLLWNFSEDDRIQEIIDRIQEAEQGLGKIFNKEELSEILSIKNPDDIFGSGLEQPSKSLKVGKVKGLMPIPVGTGFLVGRNYLLTNHHVLPTQADANNMIVEFGYEQDILGRSIIPIQCELDPSFFVTNKELDYTLVKVERKPLSAQIGDYFEIGDYLGWIPMVEDSRTIAPPITLKTVEERQLTNKIFPEVLARIKRPVDLAGNQGLRGEPVTIIQHPKGRYKQIVLFSNRVQKITKNFLYYEADSDYGSSGSPVFNQRWNLVALHRAVVASDGESIQSGIVGYEGIRISRIVNDFTDKLNLTDKLNPNSTVRVNNSLNLSEIKNFIDNYVFITKETRSLLNSSSIPEVTEKPSSNYPSRLPQGGGARLFGIPFV